MKELNDLNYEQIKKDFLKIYYNEPTLENVALALAWNVTILTEEPEYWDKTYKSMKDDLMTHDLESLLRLVWDFWKNGQNSADWLYNAYIKGRLSKPACEARKEGRKLKYWLDDCLDKQVRIVSKYWNRVHKGSTWKAVLDETIMNSIVTGYMSSKYYWKKEENDTSDITIEIYIPENAV